MFSIPYPETGEIILVKDLSRTRALSYALKIEVQDQGIPQQTTASELLIKVNFVGGSGPRLYGQSHNSASNATTAFFGDEDVKYIVIAGVVGGVTVIISIVIITILIRLRRPVSRHDRRRQRPGGPITGVQEQGDGRHFEKQLWHSVPADDITSPGEDGEKCGGGGGGDILLSQKIGGGGGGGKGVVGGGSNHVLTKEREAADVTDAYIKKHGGEQYGGQQHLYTFRKVSQV